MNHQGLKIGLGVAVGLISFSGTFPVTRFLVMSVSPWLPGSARVVLAAFVALVVLLFVRPSLPPRASWGWLALASAMVAIGFPLLSSFALTDLAASGAAVQAGVLPLLTALAARCLTGERPSPVFWRACVLGFLAVVIYALAAGGWSWRPGNNWFAGAVVCASVGYAAGARATRLLSAWQVACWLVILAAPVHLLVLWFSRQAWQADLAFTGQLVCGLGYLALFSQLAGFVGWNYALAAGGVARVGQLQLLQPFITLLLAATFLGETITLGAVTTLTWVLVTILWVRLREQPMPDPVQSH